MMQANQTIKNKNFLKILKHSKNPLKNLFHAIEQAVNLTHYRNIHTQDFYLLLNKFMLDIFCEVRNCELMGIPHDELVQTIEPIRALLGKSNFVKRLQTWPRGYPGDFETVEHIYYYTNENHPHTFGFLLENWALNLPIVHQHRNKVMHQAAMIKNIILKDNKPKNIGILGCGGCIDLRTIKHDVNQFENVTFVLNDMDKEALQLAQANLTELKNLHVINAHVLKALHQMHRFGEFDLILAGGLYDYFTTPQMTKLLARSIELLKPNGKIFFTNIAKDNPFRVFMEYGANWFLIEKDKDELLDSCVQNGIHAENVNIHRDETGLTWLVTAEK